jgi:hypothetical protein
MTIDCIPRNQNEFAYDLVRSPKSGALLRTSLSSSRFGHSSLLEVIFCSASKLALSL